MRIRLRLIVHVLCVLVAASSHGRADETKTDMSFQLLYQGQTRESCPRIVEVLKNPLLKDGGGEKTLGVIRAASWALVLDCPTEPPDLPIRVLHAAQDVPSGKGSALILAPAYEYGMRVEVDLDRAKSWYRQAAFMFPAHTEEQWDDIRISIASLNPKILQMSDAEIVAALAAGDLKSPILEKEIAAVQKLMNGPVVDIIAASDHLYQGTAGYPKSRKLAQRILQITARKGVPEAQFALALGILDGRFPALRPTREVLLLEAQRLLIKAAATGFLPAIEFYADLCENSGKSYTEPVAYALNELAKEKGGQSAEAALLRLKKVWHPSMDRELQSARDKISREKIPVCF